MLEFISKKLIEILYTLLVILPAIMIFLKTRKLFSLSMHKGIRLFSDCFIFLSLAFIFRLIGIFLSDLTKFFYLSQLANFIFTYFLVVSVLYLVYSLIWKELGNKNELFIHLLGIIIAVIGIFLDYIVYISMLGITFYGLTIAYSNYEKSKKMQKTDFSQLYLIAMFVAFLAFLINFLAMILMPFFPIVDMYAKTGTVLVILIFYYGVEKSTN